MSTEIGRPRVYTNERDPLSVASYRLTKWHKRTAIKLGKGNGSDGVRHAIEIASGFNGNIKQGSEYSLMIDLNTIIPIASQFFGRDMTGDFQNFFRSRAAVGSALDEKQQKFFVENWKNIAQFLETPSGQRVVQESIAIWMKQVERQQKSLENNQK